MPRKARVVQWAPKRTQGCDAHLLEPVPTEHVSPVARRTMPSRGVGQAFQWCQLLLACRLAASNSYE